MNGNEVQRLASVAHRIRPDWRADSIETFIRRHFADRAYRDVLIALVVVASDDTTQTPNLLALDGPWWTAAAVATRQTDRERVTPRDRCPYHPTQPKTSCPDCAEYARQVAGRSQVACHMATIRDAIRAARPDHSDDQDQPCPTTRSDAPPATNPHPEPASKSTSTANSGPATATESAATSPSAESKSPA